MVHLYMDIELDNVPPKYPLRLAEGLVQKQCGEVYKLEKEAFYDWLCMNTIKNNG